VLILFTFWCLPLLDDNILSMAPIRVNATSYFGEGSRLDVFEFAHNQSQILMDAQNDTSFTYPSSWLPSNYRGYRLHAEVFNLKKTVDPVENGDFESYPEVGNNWTLSHAVSDMVTSATTTSGGNPGSCLDVELLNSKVLDTRASYLDNNFEYMSIFEPDTIAVSFDIRFSSDITQANYLQVSVLVLDDIMSPKGLWVVSTLDFHPEEWTHVTFPTFFVNGSITLRVSIEKTVGSNLDVYGHIFLDNFKFQIGSNAPPSEVGLTLNNQSVVDTFGSNGEVDIYANDLLHEEINFEEAVFGVEREIEYERTVACEICGGSGAKPGTGKKQCGTCGGIGQVQRSQGFFYCVAEPHKK